MGEFVGKGVTFVLRFFGRAFYNFRMPVRLITLVTGMMLLGAVSIRAGSGSVSETGAGGSAVEDHWAFQPIHRPPVPAGHPEYSSAIDRFVAARLDEQGLTLSPPASREAFLRRVCFDLTGLPPTLEEREEFLGDRSARAVEKLVERLLESPRYGERWGRHWLDLARFAETDGFELDAVRPQAWVYRDYVIRSFNQDKPYDRFIQEQIAGDELWPEDPDAVAATAFNLLGPDMVDSSDPVQRRHNRLNDMTDTAAFSFLGLTLGCARCHDHKLEPLTQRDYYGFQAFFGPARFVMDRPIPTPAEEAAHAEAMEAFNRQLPVVELRRLEDPVRARLRERKLAALSPEAQAAYQTAPSERTAEQANLVLETEPRLEVPDKELEAALGAEEKVARQRLLKEIRGLPKPPALPKTMALAEGAPVATFVLHRGDYTQEREQVEPGFPAVLGARDAPHRSRADLARWLGSPENPLTARVIVNRVWQHHFGSGLVATPSDFGTRGARPSHPELLDWLASEFVADGWSLKRLHRSILLSAAYRQSSDPSENASRDRARAADPGNTLYWRMNRQRLEGEVIRDALLAISGRLNGEMGGPGVLPPIPKELFAGAAGWKPSSEEADHCRRSVYIFARRNLRFPFLEVFDAPDNNLSCPIREHSTTAPQALTLLNSDQVMAAARETGERLNQPEPGERISAAYRLILGREPSAREQALALEFLAESPFPEFLRALFNLNEFVYAP